MKTEQNKQSVGPRPPVAGLHAKAPRVDGRLHVSHPPFPMRETMETIKTLLVDDNTLLRQGLRLMLEDDRRFEVVGEVADGVSVLRAVKNLEPDLVLMEISLPKMTGIAVIKELRKQSEDIKILVVTHQTSDEYVTTAFQAGANGYLLKESDNDELINAVDIVLTGKTYISPGIAEQVMEGYIEGRKSLKEDTVWDSLTQREKEILKLVGEGHTSKEIANTLFISPKTVEKHRSNLMAKLEMRNVSELTTYAIEKGLVNTRENRRK